MLTSRDAETETVAPSEGRQPGIVDRLRARGLTTEGGARLCGVASRTMRRWGQEARGIPPSIYLLLDALDNVPGALDALRDDYRSDAPEAGDIDVPEPMRRLRWLRARFPDAR